MNKKDFDKKLEEMNSVIKNYAYFYSKRRRLEEYKKVVLVKLMKEIAAETETNVKEQEMLAKRRPEFKNILSQIKEYHKIEANYKWQLTSFVEEGNVFAMNSVIDRQMNWNIHNM